VGTKAAKVWSLRSPGRLVAVELEVVHIRPLWL